MGRGGSEMMFERVIAIALGLTALTVGGPSVAQQQTVKVPRMPILWQNVRVGMTVAEVTAAQENATRPENLDHLKSGAECLLAIPSIEVLNDSYKACFFFKNGALTQVTLNALGTPYESQFQNVVTGLRAKYGAEISLNKTIMGFEADWLNDDGVNIAVTFFNKYGNLLNINYQVRLKDDLKGL